MRKLVFLLFLLPALACAANGKMADGDIRNFGAVSGDLSDDSVAIQAAMDSPHAVVIPAGCWKIENTIVISQPKIINATSPLLQPFDNDPRRRPHRGPGPNVCESHSRIWTDQNINFFEITSPQVFIEGGTYDAQNAPNWSSAVFYYPGKSIDHNDRPNGWGGGVRDFLVIGNYLDMLATGIGGKAVYMDFQAPDSILWAYWTHMYWQGVIRGVDIGFYAAPRNTALNHWANVSSIEFEIDYSKQSVVNHAFNGLNIISKHQKRAVFHSQQESDDKASIYSKYQVNLIDPEFFDFNRSSGDINGQGVIRYSNQVSVELESPGNIIQNSGPTLFSKAKYIAGTQPMYKADNLEGYITRQPSGQALFIDELHDALFDQFQQSEWTFTAFQSGPELSTMTDNSLDAGVPLSSVIAPGNVFNWFRMQRTYVYADYTSATDDYLELHVENPGISIRRLWITFASDPKAIQVILKDENGEVFFNETRQLPPNSHLRNEYFTMHWTKFETMIVRYIGKHTPGRVQFGNISGTDSRHKAPTPMIHTGNEHQTKHGSLAVGKIKSGNGWLWIDAEGNLRKLVGRNPRYDTDGTIIE